MAGTSDDVVADVTTFLETITKKQGAELSYLGMVFKFNRSSVTVTMPKYVNDILTANSVAGSVASPATNGLYNVSSVSKDTPLLSAKVAKVFHTNVTKLLYFILMWRPDTLTAVSFLTSRVQSPTTEDQQKLARVRK